MTGTWLWRGRGRGIKGDSWTFDLNNCVCWATYQDWDKGKGRSELGEDFKVQFGFTQAPCEILLSPFIFFLDYYGVVLTDFT